MIASVNGTVVHRKGSGTQRQDRPKTDASIRRIPVPEFAAVVLRRRIAGLPGGNATRTIALLAGLGSGAAVESAWSVSSWPRSSSIVPWAVSSLSPRVTARRLRRIEEHGRVVCRQRP